MGVPRARRASVAVYVLRHVQAVGRRGRRLAGRVRRLLYLNLQLRLGQLSGLQERHPAEALVVVGLALRGAGHRRRARFRRPDILLGPVSVPDVGPAPALRGIDGRD